MGENAELPEPIRAAVAALEPAHSDSEIAAAFDTLIALIRDDKPTTEQAAEEVVAALRRGVGDRSALRASLSAALAGATSSATVLIHGLRALLGEEEALEQLRMRLKVERRELYDGVVLDRLLTAVAWQRSEDLLKHVKRLTRQLEDGRLELSAVGHLQVMSDFLKAQRKVTKNQIQKLDDLALRLNLSEERVTRLLQPYGVKAIGELRSGEAKRLIHQLSALARTHAGDRITARQLSYIRRLVRKLGLADDALSIIAEEVGQCENIAELSKEQASMVIDWLLQRTDKPADPQ